MAGPRRLPLPLRLVWELVDLVLLAQVRDGRVRFPPWPTGLGLIGVVALVGYLLAGLLVLLAVPLRRVDVLVSSPDLGVLPSSALPVLMLLVTLALSLVVTAALHAQRWALLAALLLAGSLVAQVAVPASVAAGPAALLCGSAGLAGLVLLALVRRRGEFAWFEFPLAAAAVATGTLLPLLLQQRVHQQMGFDARVLSTTQLFMAVAQVAVPAVIIGGAALAEIAVATAGWGLRVVRTEAPRGVWPVLGVALAVLGLVGAGWQLRRDPGSVLASAALLALGVLAVLLVVRGHRRTAADRVVPERLVASWRSLIVWLTLACCATVLPTYLVLSLQAVVQVWRLPGAELLVALVGLLVTGPVVSLVRLAAVVASVVLALRWSRRGEHARPLLLVAFCTVVLPGVVSTLSGSRLRLGWSTEGLAVAAVLLAVLALAGFAVTRRLTVRRSSSLMMVLALSCCFLVRDVLADPVSALLGSSAIALVLFGLVWRLLTDASWTRTWTPAFPLPARVLFFWANALVAVTSLAFVALGRGLGGLTDITPFAELGDFLLGSALYLAAVLGCFWQLLPQPRRPLAPGAWPPPPAVPGRPVRPAAPAGPGYRT
ncbi:hypothetical protein GC722_12065 [Auraticoccus sp. F435]|uniref:Uncharacterized protein n=1 Tax=Auraticoccus cholistanensis TaxID=2656650 RepID=A0A6A9UY80_9ACTN|nr:hypothetical protein [Auraticoccus cholistanensis]MVA76752.1 hypothetical protein [Auraticoccus cholistanensis]